MSEQLQNAKVIIGLIDPKSPSNVGAVMRAAGCYRADAVAYTGQRYDRAARFQTDTKNAVNNIPLLQIDDLAMLKAAGRELICVDLVEGAVALPKFTHPESAIYVFGSEDSSVSQALVDIADAVVYVPTVGCMNLAASVNVLLYDRLAKNQNTVYSDTVIKENRDRNNKVKVKN